MTIPTATATATATTFAAKASSRNPFDLRAADADREGALDRLSLARAEGRLDEPEFERRAAAALTAVTVRDLHALLADLPRDGTPSVPAEAGRRNRKGRVLRLLWRIWAAAVVLDTAAWLMTVIAVGGAMPFWPIWLMVGGGTVLAVATWLAGCSIADLRAARRSRRPSPIGR